MPDNIIANYTSSKRLLDNVDYSDDSIELVHYNIESFTEDDLEEFKRLIIELKKELHEDTTVSIEGYVIDGLHQSNLYLINEQTEFTYKYE